MKELPVLNDRPAPLWIAAQGIGIALTAALVAGLLLFPGPATHLLWNGAVPVLPAVFLVNPAIWRNACPLATLNVYTGRRRGSRRLEAHAVRRWSGLAILVLLIMVPARRLVFNHDGVVLAVTIAATGGLALLMGFFFTQKSGFCNLLCPVVPVERLYGQSPLVRVGNPRCRPCEWCTVAACTDKAPFGAVDELLGTETGAAWLKKPFGAFAVAFPGFVLGYFLLQDGGWSDAPRVYGTVVAGMAVSYLLFAGVTIIGGLSRSVLLRLAAALAIGLYYWLGAPAIAAAWELPDMFATGLRILALSLIAVWFLRASTRGGTAFARTA